MAVLLRDDLIHVARFTSRSRNEDCLAQGGVHFGELSVLVASGKPKEREMNVEWTGIRSLGGEDWPSRRLTGQTLPINRVGGSRDGLLINQGGNAMSNRYESHRAFTAGLRVESTAS